MGVAIHSDLSAGPLPSGHAPCATPLSLADRGRRACPNHRRFSDRSPRTHKTAPQTAAMVVPMEYSEAVVSGSQRIVVEVEMLRAVVRLGATLEAVAARRTRASGQRRWTCPVCLHAKPRTKRIVSADLQLRYTPWCTLTSQCSRGSWVVVGGGGGETSTRGRNSTVLLFRYKWCYQ